MTDLIMMKGIITIWWSLQTVGVLAFVLYNIYEDWKED